MECLAGSGASGFGAAALVRTFSSLSCLAKSCHKIEAFFVLRDVPWRELGLVSDTWLPQFCAPVFSVRKLSFQPKS